MAGSPVNPPSLAAPRGYSNGMVHAPGRVLFVAGQIGWDREMRFADGLTAQFEQALRNVLDVVQGVRAEVDRLQKSLPAGATLVVNVDNGVDYRRRTFEQLKLYHCPLGPQADAAMAQAFDQLAEAQDQDPVLVIEARKIQALRRAGGVVWFDFQQLCGGPRSHNDYLEIANQFHTVLLSNVPHMPVHMASQARRFTWLVDVLYDRRVKLIMSAATEPQDLYTEGPLAHEFPRTASRLHEMQSAQFMALERRVVDTGLT